MKKTAYLTTSLLFIWLLALHLPSSAQTIFLTAPSGESLQYNAVTHRGVGMTTFYGGSGFSPEILEVKVQNTGSTTDTLDLYIPVVFRDEAFRIEPADVTGAKSFTKPEAAHYICEIEAGAEVTLPVGFTPLHNIAYNTELLISSRSGAGHLSVDLRGTGQYAAGTASTYYNAGTSNEDFSEVLSYKYTPFVDEDPQPQETANTNYYGDTWNLSEGALRAALNQLIGTGLGGTDQGVRSVADLSFASGTASTQWKRTRAICYYFIDNDVLYKDLPGGTTSNINRFSCPYTDLHFTSHNNATRRTMRVADADGIPTFNGACTPDDFKNQRLQCEHSCVVTWFDPTGGTSSAASRALPNYHDLHHLYPIHSTANGGGGHSNYFYGDRRFMDGSLNGGEPVVANTSSSDAALASSNGEATGTQIASYNLRGRMQGYTHTVARRYFEPDDRQKGVVARALMYMVTRYGDSNVTINLANDYNIGSSGWWEMQGELMRQWNIEHPPTAREIRRNQLVQFFQNNRNPYSDYPQFAWRISVMDGSQDRIFSGTATLSNAIIDFGEVDNTDTTAREYHFVNTGNDPMPVDNFTCTITAGITCGISLKSINRGATPRLEDAATIAPGEAGVLLITIAPDGAPIPNNFIGNVSYHRPEDEPAAIPFTSTDRGDLIALRGQGVLTCPEITITSADVIDTDAQFFWDTPDPLPDSYSVAVREVPGGTIVFSQTGIAAAETEVYVTGLSPESNYTLSVTSQCGGDSKTGPDFPFTTLPALAANPGDPGAQGTMAVSFYPNPGIDEVNVSVEDNNTYPTEVSTQVRVIDTNGRILLNKAFEEFSPHYTLAIQDVEMGVYILEVQRGEEIVKTKLLIKR